MKPFASDADCEVCRQLHQSYGTTYYHASRLFSPEVRRRVHAVYGFVRVPDEWVDNPGPLSLSEVYDRLVQWRSSLASAIADGVPPEHPAMRAFSDVVRETGIPLAEANLFVDAMAMDLTTTRYDAYSDLETYMRGSAAAVGVMMTYAVDGPTDDETLACAKSLGNAMQLTNFLRDVREDAERGRIYLPLESLNRFGVAEADVLDARFSDRFRDLMKFEADRARALYEASHPGLRRLTGPAYSAVLSARILYSRILDRLAQQDYNPFAGRARTSRFEKATVLAGVLLGRPALKP